MAQLRLGLEGKLSCVGIFVLTSSNEEEHDCDAQGGTGIIDCEVDNADLVEDLHPIFTRVVSLRGHTPEDEGDDVEHHEEHDEDGALDLVGLELPTLFSKFRFLELEEETE